MSVVPHKEYYMKDGVSFQVQDVLFRVPRYMLETSSPILSKMLEDVGPADPPLLLPDIESDEFEHLLAFLYPLTPQLVSDSQNNISRRNEIQQWISILRLATVWDMQSIRMAAMEILSHSVRDPMTKIALGKRYNHIPWLREGFTFLCVRPEPLSVVEASQLTKEDIIACAAARENIRGLKGISFPTEGSYSSLYREYDKLLANQLVRSIVESSFLFPKEELPIERENLQNESQTKVKAKTGDEAPKFQFIPNGVVASVKEFSFSPRLLQHWGKDSWEPRLFLLTGSESNKLTGKPAVKEYLAGLSCLLLLTMGILVITW